MSKAVGWIISLVLIFLTGVEVFFFKPLLMDDDLSNIIDKTDWNFGQIVGIATWSAVIVDLMRNEIGE